MATLVLGMVAADVASAAPALNVSKAIASKPLLGGTATYTVTVQNTGADKGYNLSLTDVLSSSRPNPQGRVTLVSVSDSAGTQYPTSVATDPVTGDTTIRFINVKDLAPTETYSLTFTVDLSGDPSWQVNDHLSDTVTATVAQFPDGGGASYSGSASRSDPVLPIRLLAKTAQQSTGVEQATGTKDRVFHYLLQVRNNYLNTTNAVTLTDALPDGLEYLGATSGPAPNAVVRDPVSGITTLTWALGDMTAAQVQNIRYAAAIRYDYYGTADGGTDRPTEDFSGTPALGAPIPDKTTFTNDAGLTATYQGAPVTDAASAAVTAAYLTIAKSETPDSGGNGTVVSYTLTYSASQYYDIVDDPPTSITVTDTLPNGQTYDGDASPAPASSVANPVDGTTTITWHVPALAHSAGASITFTATVDNDWRGPLIGGLPIIAGDELTNACAISGEWDDQIDGARAHGTSTSSAAARFSTSLPLVNKRVEDPPGSDTWVQTTTRTVGDTVTFRVRFNTTDGSTPTSTDIRMGRITVTDWLPPGMTYNGDAVITPSNPADFTDPDSGPPPALLNVGGSPTVVALGGLQGLQWYLGDVAQAGWWQAVFTAHVDDVPAVADGVAVNNLWKLTGVDTSGDEYSARDAAAVNYTTPFLTLTKTATTVPNPLLPGSNVTYTTTITNSGHAAARDVLVTDTLPVGMRLAAPTMVSASLDGTPLSVGTGYVLAPAYDGAAGVFSIDFENGAVHTAIPPGSTLTLVYRDQVDATGGVAGKALTNIATVAYDTQADGSGRATPGTEQRRGPEHRRRDRDARQPGYLQDREPAHGDAGHDRRRAHLHPARHRPRRRDRLLAAPAGRRQSRRCGLGPDTDAVARADLRYAGRRGRLPGRRHRADGEHRRVELDDLHLEPGRSARQPRPGNRLRVHAHLPCARERPRGQRQLGVLAARRQRPDRRPGPGRLEHDRPARPPGEHRQERAVGSGPKQRRPAASDARQDRREQRALRRRLSCDL